MTPQPHHYRLIACEILFREVCQCVSNCPDIIDVSFMPKGLHDVGEAKMCAALQAVIDKTDPSKHEAVLMAYGLCNNGVRGLHAPVPLVIPRAHDCITLMLGSRQRYAEYFDKNPGTYFKSTGWIERDTSGANGDTSIPSQFKMNKTYQEYVEQYGEENAQYLMAALGDWLKNYRKFTYIDTGVGDFPQYKEQTRAEAAKNGLEYEEVVGSTDLLRRLVNGQWDAVDFLVVPPARKIRVSYDEGIVDSE